MKKYKLIWMFMLCSVPFISLSQQRVRALEFELGGGYSVAAKNNKSLGAGQFFMELRNNFQDSEFDFGIQLCVAGTINGELNNKGKYNPKLDETGTYLLPVVDYNFLRVGKISYFVGSGIGMMQSRVNDQTYGSLCVMPRAGIECFHHLRMTLDYKWNPRGEYNYAGINIGVVFGGGRIKK